MNASAQPIRPGTDPKEIVALLKRRSGLRGGMLELRERLKSSARQLTNPVLWEDSMKAILKEGVSEPGAHMLLTGEGKMPQNRERAELPGESRGESLSCENSERTLHFCLF